MPYKQEVTGQVFEGVSVEERLVELAALDRSARRAAGSRRPSRLLDSSPARHWQSLNQTGYWAGDVDRTHRAAVASGT